MFVLSNKPNIIIQTEVECYDFQASSHTDYIRWSLGSRVAPGIFEIENLNVAQQKLL